MKTKVFISWSGDLSKRFAESLRKWLPSALQHVQPYFSPDDIEKGAKWDNEIVKELEESSVGIICLTKENVDRQWILYESGALSKNIAKSNVCPIVLDLGKTDVTGPLARFQITELNKKDFKRLFKTINNVSGESALDTEVLNNVFNKWWPDFESQVERIISDIGVESTVKSPFREDRDLLEEILKHVRASNMNQTNERRQNEDVADAVKQLVEGLQSVWSLFEGVNEEFIREDFEAFKNPLRVLTGLIGRDDLYMHYKHNIGSLSDDDD